MTLQKFKKSAVCLQFVPYMPRLMSEITHFSHFDIHGLNSKLICIITLKGCKQIVNKNPPSLIFIAMKIS